MSTTSKPSMVSKISVNGEARPIAATYDIDGNEIKTTYGKIGSTATDRNANVYTKGQADDRFATTGTGGTVYTKTEANNTFLRKTSIYEGDSLVELGADAYLKIADANDPEDGYVKISDLNSTVSQAVEDAIDAELESGLNIKIDHQKHIKLVSSLGNYITLERVKNEAKQYGRHVKVKVYSSAANSETGTIRFDSETGTSGINAVFFQRGAEFEIYDTYLFCRASNGQTLVFNSDKSMWSTLEISVESATTVSFSALVYDEDWEDLD